MKKVINGEELYKVIQSATNLICDAVSTSIGPTGNNVIINNSDESVFITNDGVTIAKSIESDDKSINSILEIIKESSLKTDEIVGDGTTTTLVILQKIVNLGFKEILKGKNPIILKNELLSSYNIILDELNQIKRSPKKEDLLNVSSISANDKKLGYLVYEVYSKMKNRYSIEVKESINDKDYYEINKGYNIDIDNLNTIFFKDKNEVIQSDIFVLTLHGYLQNLDSISDIINMCLKENKMIIVFVDDYDETIDNEIYVLQTKYNMNIFIIKISEYGSRKMVIMEDISFLTNSKIKEIGDISYDDLGFCESLTLKKDSIILYNKNKKISKKIQNLKMIQSDTHDDYEREFIEKRISKFENGIATIYIGGTTKTEKKEKIMRVIDAINAISHCNNGIITGGGVGFLKICDNINNVNSSMNILCEALKTPFKKIIDNLGKDYNEIYEIIKKSNYELIYNYEIDDYESIETTKILDSFDVINEAIKNAISISSILLSTNYLVINDINNSKEIYL